MARIYRLKRRAERQGQTRQRIVEAAVSLHTTVGPAQTTVSAIAEQAGVQRHTFYRHFPDERSLLLACSGMWYERHPLPDPGALSDIADAEARLRAGLQGLYAYYEANAEEMIPIVRDAQVHPLTREMLEQNTAPAFGALVGILAAPFAARGARRRRVETALRVFLNFTTWQGLRGTDAVEIAVRAICAQ
jgi:AcrR family transcriptional regulator